MTTDRANDLQAFRAFVDEQLARGGAGLTLDEALALWEYENAPEEEREDTLRAIREGLEDLYAGRTRPAEEVLAEIRKKYGFGRP
jgi:hypothetical protein